MNGESQLIERVLQGLADEMAAQMRRAPTQPFQEAIFSLVYAIIMLNTDLHHPDVLERMDFARFEQNFRLVCSDDSLVSRAQLQQVFRDVQVGSPEARAQAVRLANAARRLLRAGQAPLRPGDWQAG